MFQVEGERGRGLQTEGTGVFAHLSSFSHLTAAGRNYSSCNRWRGGHDGVSVFIMKLQKREKKKNQAIFRVLTDLTLMFCTGRTVIRGWNTVKHAASVLSAACAAGHRWQIAIHAAASPSSASWETWSVMMLYWQRWPSVNTKTYFSLKKWEAERLELNFFGSLRLPSRLKLDAHEICSTKAGERFLQSSSFTAPLVILR